MPDKRVVVWVQKFPDRKNLVLQWHDPDTGRRKSESAETDDPKKAEQRRADRESDLNHGRYAEVSRMTWERFREQFEQEYVAGMRPNTRASYEDTLDLFEELASPARLRSITERTISAFVSAMRQKPTRGRPGMMPSTIKVRLQNLHTALTWAVAQKLLPAVPQFPTVKVPQKAPQPVPAESFERLLLKAAGDASMRAYLLCGWLAGLRLAEAYAMEWEQTDKAPWVDFDRSRIVLPADCVKAVKDQWIPLDANLREALEALPRHGRKVFRFVDTAGKPLTLSGISDRVVAIAKLARVRLTMHSLRKGFGCRYAGKVSAHVLQRLMRHANIKTTMDYYVNIDVAVEEAVLGQKRNDLRNIAPSPPARTDDGVSATDYGESLS